MYLRVKFSSAGALAAICCLLLAAATFAQGGGQAAPAQDSSFGAGEKGLLWEAFDEALEMERAVAVIKTPEVAAQAREQLRQGWEDTLESAKAALDTLKLGGRTDLGGPYLVIGYAHYQLGHYAEAADAYRKAVGYSDGNVPAAHYNLALAYYKLDRGSDARRELSEAARVQPQYAGQANYRALSALLGSASPAAAPASPSAATTTAATAEASKEVPLGVFDLDMPSKGIAGGLLRVDHFEALNGVLVAFARLTGRVNGTEVDEPLKLPVDVKPCAIGLCLSYHYPALSSMRRLGFTESYENLAYDPAPGDKAAWYPKAARDLIRETQQRLWNEKNLPADWLAQRLNEMARLLAHPPYIANQTTPTAAPAAPPSAAANADPTAAAKSHFDAGVAAFNGHDLARAEAEFKEALRLAPNYPNAHFALAGVLYNQNKNAEAEAEYRAALAQSPNAMTHAYLGDALSKQGRAAEAEAEYREAVRLDPNSKDVPESYRRKAQTAAQAASAPSLAGTSWVDDKDPRTTYDFLPDGRVLMLVCLNNCAEIKGTWKQEGAKVTLKLDIGTAEATINGNRMAGALDGDKWSATKK